MLFSCKACDKKIDNYEINNYYLCPICGSATYITLSSALEDNKEYFNSIYSNKNLQVINARKYLFIKYLWLDTIINFKENKKFAQCQKKISELIVDAEKSLEIGFGKGDEMMNYLRSGANIYGLDLSLEAVRNFKENYPEFSEKVACKTAYDFPVDVVYSNALFEHLDNPSDFLDNAYNMLNPGGKLIIRLPVITGTTHDTDKANTDINFWKPCHRALYSLEGLTILLSKYCFSISDYASSAYYGYKVMSRMVRLGYRDIEYKRNPYYKLNGLDSFYIYNNILLKSLFDDLVCLRFYFDCRKSFIIS